MTAWWSSVTVRQLGDDMRGAIRSIVTTEHDVLQQVSVDDVTNMSQWIRVLAGPAGEQGEESFDLNVCTPQWLQGQVARTGPIVGRHLLIVDRWDIELVERAVSDLVAGVEADDWDSIAGKLSRIGRWEFEDYRA